MALAGGRMSRLRLLQKQLVAGLLPADAAGCLNASRSLPENACSTSYRPSLGWMRRQSSSTAQGTAPASRSRGPVSYVSLAVTLGTGTAIVLYFRHQQEQRLQEMRMKQQVAGRAAIGGPFQLIDQEGRPFTNEDLLGEFALIYFGFTFCPDICPEELEKLTAAVDGLDTQLQEKLQPVFISIDPERDNVKQVKSYVQEFHPRLIGLTGTLDKVKEAARAYRVYFTKTDENSDDYLVDHSIIMYLINPKGEFVTFYGKNYSPAELSESIGQHMQEWKW